MSKLTPSLRKQIINDYIHGIPNQDYRVIKTSNGSYQVRKRVSKFKMNIPASQEFKRSLNRPVEEEMESEPEEQIQEKQTIKNSPEARRAEPKPKDKDRLTNEDLLRKLSTLLNVPEQNTYESPEEFEHEEEAYHEDQEMIQQAIRNSGNLSNMWGRKPLRLY